MKFLNLNKIEMLGDRNQQNKLKINFQTFKFSAGEQHIKIEDDVKNEDVTICFQNPEDIMLLVLAVSALRKSWVRNIDLLMPYVPYGRQDRVMVPGEPLSIQAFANIINSMNFRKVFVLDAHSSVTTALLDNVVEIDQTDIYLSLWEYIKIENEQAILISPDAGSFKKINKIGEFLDVPVIACSKIRDVQDGKITNIVVHWHPVVVTEKTCVIMDDICDGGRTFIALAKVLKTMGAKKVILYTTHGIYSYGLDQIFEYIDQIHTTNNMGEKEVNVWPLNQSMLY